MPAVILPFAFGAATSRAMGDGPAPPARKENAEDPPTRGSSAEVYLNDSFEAADAISRARGLADDRQWSEAASLLQRTSDSSGDKLVAVSEGYYVGIRDHISGLICAWPEEGLAEYRLIHERELATALSSMSGRRDARTLLGLLDRYFCTSGAAELADTIGQIAIESGDLTLAEHVYRRVLERHPDASRYARSYGAMLALISEIRGKSDPDAESRYADVQVRWKGSDRPFGEVVTDLRASFEVVTQLEEVRDWPIFGGRPERNRLGAASIDELGLLWRCGTFAGPKRTDDETASDDPFNKPSAAGSPSMHAVVSGEFVFVQRYRDIAAIHRNTGVVAWRFRADATPASDSKELDDQQGQWASVTVVAGRVFAALPGDIVPYYGFETAQSPPEIICLDAQTGSVIWRRTGSALADGTRTGSELSFDSTPVVAHGAVYIVARRRRSFGFEDCYVYGLDARSGRVLFHTHVGSASTGTFGAHRPTMAMLTLRGDTIYVCTNLGCTAAVSAHTGVVRWIRLYERDADDSVAEPSWGGRPAEPPDYNPVFWSGGRLVFLPLDAAAVYVLAADEGRLIRKIPVTEFGAVDTLLGVSGELICGVGGEVSCYDLGAGELLWSSGLSGLGKRFGRGTWSADHLLIPTDEALVSYSVSDGSRSSVSWDTEGTGGNLLATPDQLYVAGRDYVSAYVRKEELWNALRSRMKAAPNDPLPALELAEVALRGGEVARALEVLDQAVARAGGYLDTVEPPLKRRFFNDAIMFADVLSKRSALEPEILERLFALASQSPVDAEAHLRYRFRFAEIFEAHGRPDRALRLYQQIMRDRSLRERAMGDGGEISNTASARAQARIRDLIERHGRALYEPFEAEAQRWLATGRESGDAALLARLVATFPNSDAAPRALIEHGKLMTRAKRPTEAARLFARAYNRYPRHVNRPELIRYIADAYELAGQPRNAYRWLTKAAREHPAVTTQFKGRPVTFLEYRARLANVREKVEPSPPGLVLPLEHRRERKFDEAVTLLVPRFADHPACRWSRYFVSSDRSVRAFDARSNAEVWAKPVPVRSKARLLIATSDVAIFATLYEILALDLETGEVRWSVGEYPPDFNEQLADWENGESYRTHALHDDRLVSLRNNGEMSCISIETGRLIWSQVHRPVPVGPVCAGDPWVVYHVVQDGGAALCRLDAATGAWVGATQTGEERSVADLFLAIDAQVVLASTKFLAAYDLETGEKRWERRVSGHVRPGSVLLDIDAIYVSEDGRTLRKIGLEDGRVLWESERLSKRAAEEMTVRLHMGSLIIGTLSSSGAVDEVTGLTLWHGTTPQNPNFVYRLLTQAYLVAVDLPDDGGEAESVAYFYDHRNASGVIPGDGGAKNLGKLANVRAVLAVDGALLVQDGSTIISWSHE